MRLEFHIHGSFEVSVLREWGFLVFEVWGVDLLNLWLLALLRLRSLRQKDVLIWNFDLKVVSLLLLLNLLRLGNWCRDV